MKQKLEALVNNPWSVLWAARRAVGIGACAGLLLAAALCAVLPASWQARMTVGPAGRGAGPDLSAFLPASESPTIQYLLQRVGSVTAADFAVYEMLMTSPRLAVSLTKDESLKNRLKDACSGCGQDSAKLADWLARNVRIRPVGATQMRRITLQMHDKVLATDILRALHRLSDETIRGDVRIRTDQRITYLREKLGEVANPDQRDALVGLLKEQERTRMMVGIDNDFSSEMIDPPSVPARPAMPDPYILLPLLMLLGAGAGFGVYLRK